MDHQALSKAVMADSKTVDPVEAKYLYRSFAKLLAGKLSHKKRSIFNAIMRYRPKTLLDVGCGYGVIALALASRGVKTVGIDLREHTLQAGRAFAEKYGIVNVELHCMDACAITLSNFDVAISTDFYEHLPYSSQAAHLKSVHKALNSGGVYIIRAPHKNNIPQTFNKEHIGLPSYASIIDDARAAGFTPAFFLAHTNIMLPFAYQPFVERQIWRRCKNDKSVYRWMKRFGLANVFVCLKKN